MLKKLSKVVTATTVSALLGIAIIASGSAQTAEVQANDPGAYYKAKCVACHGQKAEKKFNSALPEAEQLDAILKGKKSEKPPHMPAYEAKGVTADQAKALLAYMKQL
jgi:mono/diheme cytochrome c family protein